MIRFIKMARKYMKELDIEERNFMRMKKDDIKRKARTADTNRWRDELERKGSLEIYRMGKQDIKEEKIYDNRPASITLYRARANCLNLNIRNRHKNLSTACNLCETEEEEDLNHFLLHCDQWIEERSLRKEFQRPYEEDQKKIIVRFLFEEENLEEKEIYWHNLWLE